MIEAWDWLLAHPDKVVDLTLRHLWIAFVASSVATAIGVPAGIYVAGRGRERLAETVLYIADIMMTVPSLALFGLLMLLLSAMNLTTIGFVPAVVALVIYGQMPIMRNTYIAIQQVDPALIEAARGMGMTEGQILLRVNLRLATPLIMAGLRNALVIIIGIATIAAFIGASGLGSLIFRGITNGRMDLILVGSICVALLALMVDGLMHLLERQLTPKGIKKG